MKRVVETEMLDLLPDHDPGALGSRADIQRINFLMGNLGTLLNLLGAVPRPHPTPRIVELGAGDGQFMLRLACRLSHRWKTAHVLLVDSKDVVTRTTRAGFAALGWSVQVITCDVFDWLRHGADQPADAIVTNLFLHQFDDPALSEMLRLVAERTNLFAACEPHRSHFGLILSRMLGVIGCNAVTRHDAIASVRAGFVARELSARWPADGRWRLTERSAKLFTHAFVAERMNDPQA